MRERTPSADDTPKRAPSAPTREAASADVAGSGETPNDDLVVGYRTAKLSVSSASGTTSSDKMVASTQNLDDLGVNHPANASSGDHQQHQQQQQQQQQQQLLQERYGHVCRSAQTAQDKRSRLSNVINNLRKKVPDGTARSTTASESPRKEEDGRNSIERNLETLEKYVMTVLNRVIKDDDEEEDKNVVVGGKSGKNVDKTKESDRSRRRRTDEEPTTVKPEHSDKGDIEAAVVPRLYFSVVSTDAVENAESSEIMDYAEAMAKENIDESGVKINQESKELSRRTEEGLLDENVFPALDSHIGSREASRERKENRSLGTIIMDRLSEHQVEERANVDDGRGDRRDEHTSENIEMRMICRELLEDLLNDVYRTINENNDEPRNCERLKEVSIEGRKEATESRMEETKDTNAAQELSVTSLHCSLPLDKVASVLQKCQMSECVSRSSTSFSNSPSIVTQNSTQKSSSSSKSSSCASSIRLLCLYCDRKFLSISLRQRHTERVHQLGGGRRSERNPRKPSQNCQYCSEKCADTLEGLFQHMVGTHGDKYHVCVQCSTRYPTREALMGHMGETHSGNVERANQIQPEKIKEGSLYKESCSQNVHDKVNVPSMRERKSEEKELENQSDGRMENDRTKLITPREPVDNNPASPEFDSSFYSNVSCNIRENLLNHLDGKLQIMSGSTCIPVTTTSTMTTTMITESKSQQQQQQQQPQQSCYEHNVNQIQFPIDISLTAATPVYSKDYASEEYENSSEYARKAGKTSSGSRPRRVSFEKYNFPRKYDGRGQWTCSIKDLSNFDISTQLLLRKKQQLIKERLTISRLQQTSVLLPSETTKVPLCDSEQSVKPVIETATDDQKSTADDCVVDTISALDVIRCDLCEPPASEIKQETISTPESSPRSPNRCTTNTTDFSAEFANFMRLRRREQSGNEITDIRDIAHAELSGEWSRPRIYVCGACGSRQITLKEMEDHKASTHPHVLCSHFELAGDQREYYKHLYLPGRNAPTDEAQNVITPTETVCTKCTKNYQGAAELHRHMLECGGDHAWLLGLTGSGKKKCKWRPFGSRSRRRRQRGMKRNIQNSQSSPRVSTPRERQPPAGPRVRPSDRESIQKMLANLPPKRATRRILQDNAMRSQGRLRNVQTRTRPRIIGDNSSASRISRNKAALRNKLLKNAKSIQRNRCRSDNISAVIESVVKNCHENEKRHYNDGENTEAGSNNGKDAKEINEVPSKINKASDPEDKAVRSKIMGRFKIFGKTRNVRAKAGSIASLRLQGRSVDKLANFKAKSKSMKFKNANMLLTKTNASDKEVFFPKSTPKNVKMISRPSDDDDTVSADGKKVSTTACKNKLSQGVPKRKRPVDPVASLNASIKAKSQLRTQDGKFARNPNKTTDSSVKSSETKVDDGKHNKTSDSIVIKSKLRATQKPKKAEQQQPRRVTRLSSDSDKMPTLEPVVQISNEEYADKFANDLPILSPATSSTFLQEQKMLRTVTKCTLREKENDMEIDTDLETAVEKVIKEQKQPRGRRPKEEAKDMAKRKEIDTSGENETSTAKNSLKILKDDRAKRRKNLPINNISIGEDSKEQMSKGDKIGKKDTKTKKEEVTKETRSNSKARHEKDSSNLQDIPFEVKKLLGSASKEDLLNTLELASNDCSSKRNLRQSAPRSRMFQMNDKYQRGFAYESSNSKGVSKREKIETIRKSVRKNDEKKDDKTRMILDNGAVNNAITSAVNNIQLERAECHQSRRDSRIGAKASLINAKNMPSSKVGSNSLRKGNGLLGKRRSRNKSVEETIDETDTCAVEEHICSGNTVSNGKENDKGAEEIVSKTDKIEIENESNSNSYDRLDSAVINLNLSHLQLETSNSVDSGKENSLEISLNTHKLKIPRPKKIWGARRERAARKRSLINVIGILTEGMNIPVEAQQSVVLTVQTSLDNDPDRLSRNGVVQQSSGEDNVVAVDSFSELALTKNNESSENEVVTANATTSHHRVDNIERNIHSSPGTAQNDENSFVNQEVDISKIASAQAYSPTNDIILDLSRRKPKGKGSFLEKIVSKIVKQKDALLEGEMGTLLDTAADELTSILDEVGPTFTDNMESTNSDEVSQTSRNDDSKGSMDTSTDKESMVITDSNIQSSKDNKTVNDAVSECSAGLSEIQDDLAKNAVEKNEIQVQSENQIKMDFGVLNSETKEGDTVEKTVSNATRSIEKPQIEFRVNKSTMDDETIVPLEISNEIPLSMTDNSTEVPNSLDTMQKTDSENVAKENNRKSERKFNKRSLDDANSSTKSKRRSVEINEEHVEENMIQRELRLDDIIAFIHKPEEISSIENELPGKDDVTHKTLNVDTEMETIQDSESKIMKNLDSSSEKNLTECADGSNLEKSVDLSKVICDDAKKSYLKKSTNGIISDEEAIATNAQPKKSPKENMNSLELSLEKCKKSADRIQRKNQNESSFRYTSKRNSQPALNLAIPPLDVSTDIPQISSKSIDKAKEISSSSHVAREQSLGLTDEQSIKVEINEASIAPVEKCLSPTRVISNEETQNTNSSSSSISFSAPPKITKKSRRKKKSLADEHLDLSDDECTDIASNFDKKSNIENSNERLSSSLEQFKVPEVTDVLQSTKKRGPKRKSLPDIGRCNGGNVLEKSCVNEDLTEIDKSPNVMDKTEDRGEADKCTVEEKSSAKKLERSNSSGSIELIAPAKTRVTSRRKQLLSTEDLVESVCRDQCAENTDDLSESSCVSEFSYFRKKRLAKKKKKEEVVVIGNNTPDDPSVTDLKRPKNEKQNAKRNIGTKSLLDEHLDLSDADDIDVPTDIQASLENTETLEDMERKLEHTEKSSSLQNERANETMAADDPANNDSRSAVEQSTSNNYDLSDDLIAPKKRAAGNFVVAHTKNGEILIVEKKKKLTKEAPRFFCDVCETSFTRKSSLKKHTLSQSHLSQVSKSTKIDKTELSSNNSMFENAEEINNDWKNDQANDQLTKDSSENMSLQRITENPLELNKSCASYADSEIDSPKSLTEPSMMKQQQALEDELLDEEICKITENMSHDEYVLTDHVTPEQPEASSTPIKPPVQQKEETSKRRKHGDKKRNKKRNLAEEHLILDSPELNRSRVESDELPNPVDDVVQFSISSCERSSTTKEIIKITEEIVDISEKTHMTSVKTENQIGSITESSGEKAECSKPSNSDTKAEEHTETIRTTRSTLKKLSKASTESKEENQVISSLDGDKSSNRFSLRPRRSKKIWYYSEFDVDGYFMDISMVINGNETDDNPYAQKGQNEMEEENSTEVLREAVELRDKEDNNTANKISEDAEKVTSKPELIIDSKKIGKKRGRPKLKNRITSNSSVTLPSIESEINVNSVTVTDASEEPKIDDQKSRSPARDHSTESGKLAHLDTNTQASKPKRGRPRKNVVQVITSASVSTDNSNSNVYIPIKLNHDDVNEKTEEIASHSEIINEEIVSIGFINSLTSKADSLTASENRIQKSSISKTKKKNERSNIEKDAILFTDLSTSAEGLEQEARFTDVKIPNIVLTKDSHSFDVPSEKDSIINISYDAKCVSENKNNTDGTSINILINTEDEPPAESLSQITKETQKNVPQDPSAIDTLGSIMSNTIDNNENSEVQKLSDDSESSEKKRIKLGEEFHDEQVCELRQEEPKLSSEPEGSENEASVTDNKSLPEINSHKLLSQQIIDNTINTHDEKTNQLETSSKMSKASQSTNKERETNHTKSKASRGRSTRIAMTKVAELSSDSENEDEIESPSSSKNKIVKSVFGRVFSGEKVDKVKEVLNDWVSRSEDDSNTSRSASEARSCTRGSAKVSENGYKKGKNRHSSNMRKDTERSAKKKGNDKSDGAEIHGRSKNRKKHERNFDSAPKGHIESLPLISSIKRKCRKSKIRANEIIRRTINEEELILGKLIGWANSEDWENLRVDHNAHGKSNNHSSCHKKRDADTRNEHSSSPPQFSMFKCKRRESKTKISERIRKPFDNDTSSCPSDDQNSRDATKERDTLYEPKDTDRLDNPKSIEGNDSDIWKNWNLENQEQIETSNTRGKSRKDSINRKRQNFNAIKDNVGKMKIDEKMSKDFDNEPLTPTRHHDTKNEMQNNLARRCTSESKNQSKNLTIDKNNGHEFFPCSDSVASNYAHQDQNISPMKLDQQVKASVTPRRSKQEHITEDWTLLSRTLDAFCQKDLAENNEPSEKDITQGKNEEFTISSRSCSSLACEEPTTRDQSDDFNDQNSQLIRDSDDDNDEEEEEEDNDDNELGRRRMSPFYARETPDSSMESDSNNEEEDEEEEEEKRIIREDNSKKANLSEFSGEKVVIRSPSLGHRTDVVTIAPTDAIEDNALDVPREIKSTMGPRQGKILNFDEELFVECCSRLKATSENELRGTKKIKLDTEFYHRRDDQPQGYRVNRDRWRDVESQNSLGSLLESVNQLLGEEMYSGNEKSYRTRGSERSSRSASPDTSRADNLGYEDSLDVAFEHNNKLRDKIQQRMRESENLLASTFGQKTNGDDQDHNDGDKRDNVDNSYSSIHETSHLSVVGTLNKEQELSLGHKSKMNPTLGGLLDKALSNLLHSNGKHDHNGSAPMKLLAELACARAPTSTSLEDDTTSGKNHQSVKVMAAMAAAAAAAAAAKDSTLDSSPRKSTNDTITMSKSSPMKKTRNPIKELFERKKEINDRKNQERSKAAALVELNMQRQRKSKKNKKKQQQEFPLIRRNEHYGGLVEKKKRRDSFERKAESLSERIKDVYEFDEEESQIAPALGSVMSYRSQTDKNYETSSWSRTKNVDKSLDTTLEKDRTTYIVDMKLDPTIERKFRELENFAPKTKGALKSFQSEEQQQQQRVVDSISGPMDEFIERKRRLKRSSAEYNAKTPRFKKRSKSLKKRVRNAWYENDSSDEFRTAAKASEDVGVGVGISKSQRTCSRGKQNLFAELSTSSESEYEQIDIKYETANEQHSSKTRKSLKKSLDIDNSANHNEQIIIESRCKNEDQIENNWRDQSTIEEDATKKNRDTTKSESELSDHSLIIDERKTSDETRNSDDDADNQYERTFELDDLYREDSSDAETEVEENETVMSMAEEAKNTVEAETLDENATKVQTDIMSTNAKEDYASENELIPLEEALNLLDQHEDLEPKSENLRTGIVQRENVKIINSILRTTDATSNDEILNDVSKRFSPTEARDEKEEVDDDIPALPEKLSSNEKPQKESDNLPLHVFLSRKVQESKKRKQQQLDKLREEQERILMDFQPTRRQRKCAIGKQGLLAEISSSDEEPYTRDNGKRSSDRSEYDNKIRKKKESKEKRKERYIEKKHEQMIAKEQKAIEEEILREVKRKEILAQSADDSSLNAENTTETKVPGQSQKKKHQTKDRQMKISDEKETEGNVEHTSQSLLDSSENIHDKLEHAICIAENIVKNDSHLSPPVKRKKCSKSPAKAKKFSKAESATNPASKQRSKQSDVEKPKNRAATSSGNKDSKERKTSNGKRDSDDEELKTSKSWNKVEEGVGIAIGRRKRAAALQLYYWSSSSDEEEPEPDPVAAPEEEEEDDRQEQHGWIVGDSHKRMITMLAMEKQLKEKRRRSEDEFEPGKTKSKKHRNSTS